MTDERTPQEAAMAHAEYIDSRLAKAGLYLTPNERFLIILGAEVRRLRAELEEEQSTSRHLQRLCDLSQHA